MAEPTSRTDNLDLSRLDGRIAFATATFLLAYSFVALLDRVGAPSTFVAALAPAFTLTALATLGALLHSMRVSFYYTAGRAVPASYAGFANAAILLGLALPFAPQFAGRSWLVGQCGGFFLGLAGVAFYLGPLLRKTRAFSLSGLLAARFPGLAPRIAIVSVTGVSAICVALAGHQTTVDALVSLTGAGRGFASLVVGAAILLIAVPGGLSGVIWAAAAAAGVTLAGFGWPVLMLALHGQLPGGPAGSWTEATAYMEGWGAITPPQGAFFDFAITAAVALGVLTLAPVLAPAVTTRDVRRSRRAGFAAVVWTATLAALIATSIAGAALVVTRSAAVSPDRLPDILYNASERGLITICGAHASSAAQAREACAKRGLPAGSPLRPQDIAVSGDFLLSGLPQLEGMGAAFSGLLTSALMALGLVLAASGLQAGATAIGHEAVYHMRGETDLTSRRLATTRLALIAVTAFGSASSSLSLFDPRALIGLALCLSAASIAPVAALAIWPRAGDREALIALMSGLVGMVVTYFAMPGARPIDVFALAALCGGVLGFSSGALSALLTPYSDPHNQMFVTRMLRGDGEVMGRDKGA